MNRSEGFFKGYQNQELFYQTWVNEEAKENLILITHGIGEHSESYSHFCEGMIPGNYDVISWDLRGHGRSEGKRAVGSLREYVADLNCFIKMIQSKYPNKNIYLLGHSMGGLILMEYLLKNQKEDFKAIVFSSPLLGLSVQVPFVKDLAARALVKFLPKTTLFNELNNEDLTHDQKILEGYEKDPLRHDQVCPRLYLDVLDSLENIRQKVKSFHYPVLMQLAGIDRLVSLSASEEIFGLLGSEDKTKIVYDKMFHEIYNEIDRPLVYKDLTAWLENH